MLRSQKLLIDLCVVVAVLLMPPVLAGESETVINCTKGEVQDDREEPQCCHPNLLKEVAFGRICVTEPSDMSVAVAITLILSFTFLISLQYFMNHSDIEMREYAYTVISSTVSIFSAVLLFQSLNGLAEDLVSEPVRKATGMRKKYIDLAVNFGHMLFWYALTQLSIAHASCALKPDSWRKMELLKATHPDHVVAATEHDQEHGHTNVMLDIEINSVCFGMVLAHLTGFAAIKFWTELQQIHPFNNTPLATLAPIPIAVIAQLFIERLTDVCRERYIAHRGDKDWFVSTWSEKCQHAEDDIMGLTLSVMIVNSLRYAINSWYGYKCYPNSEQKETGKNCEFQHSAPHAFCVFFCGVLFVIALFFTQLRIDKASGDFDKRKTLERQQSFRIKSLIVGDHSRLVEDDKEKVDWEEIAERAQDVCLTTLSMSHAWCIFHGTQTLLKVVNPQFLGKEQNAATLAVVLACGVTYIEIIVVRILDIIAELPDEWTPPEVDDSIKTVIHGSSIFIGFAWEQTFDESVDQLAERTRYYGGTHAPAFSKFVIGTACIGVVFFAWKWYILPFVFKKGWRYGYVFSRNDLHERCAELAEHDQHFSVSHLHDVAHKLAEHDNLSRFNSFRSKRSVSYTSLPCSEVEALRAENQEMKIYTRCLEEQLTRRKSAEDSRLVCENCGHEFPQGFLEAKGRDYLLEFLERHLEEEKMARADHSREGEKAAVNGAPARTFFSATRPRRSNSMRSSLRRSNTGMSWSSCASASQDLRSVRFARSQNSSTPATPSDSELRGSGPYSSMTASPTNSELCGSGPNLSMTASPSNSELRDTTKSSLREEMRTNTSFEMPDEIAGQEFKADQMRANFNHVEEEGGVERIMSSESISTPPRRTAGFASPSLAGKGRAQEYFKANGGHAGQDFGLPPRSSGFASPSPSDERKAREHSKVMDFGKSSPPRRSSGFVSPSLVEERKSREYVKKWYGENNRQEICAPQSSSLPLHAIEESGDSDCKKIHQGLRRISIALQKLDVSEHDPS